MTRLRKLQVLSFLTLVALGLGLVPALAQTNGVVINVANLRIVNALVGLGSVDIYLDGARVAYSLPPEASTPYLTVAAGKHILTVQLPNADPLSAPVTDLLLDLAPNESKTAIVYQRRFASNDYRPSIEQSGAIYVVNDDRSSIALGKTRLTGVHLAVGAPEVVSVAYPSRESILHQLTLERPYGTIDISAGMYTLTVVNARSPQLDILSRIGDYSFYSNTLYTVIIVPNTPLTVSEGQNQRVVPTQTDALRTFIVSAPIDPPADGLRLRVIHAAPNTAVLDLYVDGRLAAARVNYSRITEYLGMEDYSHVITLRRAGAEPDTPPLAEAQFQITTENQPQRNWTLLLLNAGSEDTTAALPVQVPGDSQKSQIINTPGGRMFMVLLPDNISQTRLGYARIRLVNAVNAIPPLRILTPQLPLLPPPRGVIPTATPQPPADATPQPPVQLVEEVTFAVEASEAEVSAGLYSALDFTPAGTTNNLAELSNFQMIPGMVYTFIAIGSPVGNPPISVVWFADYGAGTPVNRLYVGKIVATNANVRLSPSPDSGIIRQLPRNMEVEVLGRNLNGDWLRIRYNDPDTGTTREGWVSSIPGIITVTRLGVPINILALPRYVVPGSN